MSKIIGDTIKKIRKECGLTQYDVAEKLFTTPQNISRVESGEGEPTVEMLIQLSELFDVSLDTLVGKTTLSKNEILKFTENYFMEAPVNELNEHLFSVCRSILNGRFKAFSGDECSIDRHTFSTITAPNLISVYADRNDCPKIFLALQTDDDKLSIDETDIISDYFKTISSKRIISIIPRISLISNNGLAYDKDSLCNALGISTSEAENVISSLKTVGCLKAEKVFVNGIEVILYFPYISREIKILLSVSKLLLLRNTDGNAR